MIKRGGILCIVVAILFFAALHIGFSPEKYSGKTMGVTLLGGTAFLLMTSSIFLATRAGFVEQLFGGLDRMYQVHKFCGVIAGILLLVHFFGAIIEIPESLSSEMIVETGMNSNGVDQSLINKNLENERDENGFSPFEPLGVLALILLVLSLALTLNRKIPYHKWRLPHKAMGIVYFLAIAHFMTAPPPLFERFSPAGLLLVLAGIVGVSSYFYSIFSMNRGMAHHFLIDTVNHLERATEIILKPSTGTEKLDFKPGQFAFIEIQGEGWSEPHPFTISSGPEEKNLRFTIKTLGDWTRKLREEITTGGKVVVRGPYGCFDAAKASNKQVWLAGGIGITPFLSKIRDMSEDDPREIILLYAVREKTEALFLDELQAKAQKIPNLKIVLLQSNNREFARVSIMEKNLTDSLGSYDYFLCGPASMTNGLKKDLRAAGVSKANIHSEAFEFR